MEKEGYTISDKQIGETFENIIDNSAGRVIVALFASNIARIQQIHSDRTKNRKQGDLQRTQH